MRHGFAGLARVNPTNKGKIIRINEVLPDSEDDRTAEALELCRMIVPEDYPRLTTWELQTVEDVRQGKAATKVRLRELRQIVKRLQEERP